MKRMVDTSFCFFPSIICFFFFFNSTGSFASPTRHLCRPDQMVALLDFKNEFQIQKHEFGDLNGLRDVGTMFAVPLLDFWVNSPCDPKTKSWKNNSDCCFWDGVTCDADSGMVIGLDLFFSCLAGRFKSNSSVFRLNHLQKFNLAYNNLSSSSIPAEFNKLTRLKQLDLSHSAFSGRIPSELSQLTKLEFLNLSTSPLHPGLFIETSFLSKLARNLTNLRELGLSYASISSAFPKSFVNLSSLRLLHLEASDLLGEFPSGVFQLPHIRSINLKRNTDLTFSLSEFHSNNSLERLDLSLATSFGNLPDSIGNLRSLNTLGLSGCNFMGRIPSSLGNLSLLTYLDLWSNNFIGTFPSSLFKIPLLTSIDLSENQLSGPLEFGNISSRSRLTFLILSNNNFDGPIPRSMLELVNLRILGLSNLNLGSSIDLSIFSRLKSLTFLDLSGNNISIANDSSISDFPIHLGQLRLSTCNISKIPELLRVQQDLWFLDLSNNRIEGKVPEWLWRLPKLEILNISHNSFNKFEGSSEALLATRIRVIDMRSNAFRGPFPAPPPSTQYLFCSNNHFTGKLPRSMCKLNSLEILDLSNNNFSGSIPQCLGNFSNSLSVLNLRNNSLSGTLPEAFNKGSKLRTLDVGHNRLVGKLPKSLTNCNSLEVLNVESNRINDTFPFWLETLPELQVLIIRSNEFHGPIFLPGVFAGFPKLRIIDISHNDFVGTLPSDYFANWTVMSSLKTNDDHSKLKYMGDNLGYYQDSIVLMNKGLEMELVRILTIYTAIDFSGNRLRGQIPESIGLLKELIVLNLSDNAFTGQIPPSLANLTELESLDISRNKLSGKIPPELGRLSRLARINFSHNQLVGPIPQGPQFQTQNSSSFEGNLGLCGLPLKKSCGDFNTPTSQQIQQPESEEEVVNWIAAAIGYAPGLVLGLTIGHVITLYKHEWFMRIFGRNRHGRTRT